MGNGDKVFLLTSNFVPKGLSDPVLWLHISIKSLKKNMYKSDFEEIFLNLQQM